MSKGLSKLQLAIVGLLDGTLKRQCFGGSGALMTAELLAELQELDLVRRDMPRKLALFTVRRACISLLNRDILTGTYEIHSDYPWAKVLEWDLVKKDEPPPKTKPKGKGR